MRTFSPLRWLQTSVTLAAAIGIAGIAAAQTKVVIGTGKDPNLGAPLIVAQEQGFFRDAGLDVELKFFPSGGDLMTAFAGGSIKIGSSGSAPTTSLRARPFPVRIVGRVSDISGAQQLIVRKEVMKIEELHGKKIGVMRGTASEGLLNSVARAYGLDLTKTQLINMGPVEMLQSFARGQVDAIAGWEPHTTKARAAGNGKVLVSGTKSYIGGKEVERRIYGDNSVLFTTESFLKEDPKTVEAVVRAVARAGEYMAKNREAVIAFLGKEFGMDAATMADVYAANRYTIAIDQGLMEDLDNLSAFLHSLKRIKEPVKAASWVDTGPLRAVAPDMVKIK